MWLRAIARSTGPLLLVIGLTGCFVSQREEIPGTYVAEYGEIVDRLDVKADGTFEQELLLKATNRRISAVGKWEWDSERVVFSKEFLIAVDDFGTALKDPGQPHQGEVALEAVRILGKTRLSLTEDVYYRRQ